MKLFLTALEALGHAGSPEKRPDLPIPQYRPRPAETFPATGGTEHPADSRLVTSLDKTLSDGPKYSA